MSTPATTVSADIEACARAAPFLEQAVKVGCQDPRVWYMLGVCYRRLGRNAEAANALGKIPQADAKVNFQLGLLAFADNDYAAAEQTFARSWELAPASYQAAYNLLLSRLCQGRRDAAAELMPRLLDMVSSPPEKRFLTLLQALLQSHDNGDVEEETVLRSLTIDEEQRLLATVTGLGRFEIVFPMLRRIAALRPDSSGAQEAYLEAIVHEAKQVMDRGQWEQAQELLSPWARWAAAESAPPAPLQAAILNLLGCCASMQQDFEHAVWYFNAALDKAGDDAWLRQNLALAYEWQGRLDYADTQWNRYFEALERSAAPVPADYRSGLEFEGLARLADVYSKRENWTTALSYLQRAARLRPDDPELLERLFQLYTQMKRPQDARKTLRRLREIRPHDPQFDLYELDIRELRTVADIERLLADIRRTISRYPNDMRVEERAAAMAVNMLPVFTRLVNDLSDQLNKVVEQMRRLPSYQVNWPAVREVTRDLEDEFLRLRRAAGKGSSLVGSEEHRRSLRNLISQIDRKIEVCHSLGS